MKRNLKQITSVFLSALLLFLCISVPAAAANAGSDFLITTKWTGTYTERFTSGAAPAKYSAVVSFNSRSGNVLSGTAKLDAGALISGSHNFTATITDDPNDTKYIKITKIYNVNIGTVPVDVKIDRNNHAISGSFNISPFTYHFVLNAYNGDLDYFNYDAHIYHQDLAETCAEYAMLAYDEYVYDENQDAYYYLSGVRRTKDKNSPDLNARLQEDGYQNINFYNYTTPSAHTATYAVGHKKVLRNGAQQDLVAVIVRGTNGVEWYGNMDVTGASYNAAMEDHYSFRAGAKEIENAVYSYMLQNNLTDSLFLVTGHSRGAAIANLVARDISKPDSILYHRVDSVFGYTFATPNCTTDTALDCDYIYNFCFLDDFVPQVPLSQWGYSKYGTTYYAVAENLYGLPTSFAAEENLAIKRSTGKSSANFDYGGTQFLLGYVNGFWGDTSAFYNKTYGFNGTLYQYFRNGVAPVAIDMTPQTVIGFAGRTTGLFIPIGAFFLNGQALHSNINDTHQAITYYNALKNGGFNTANGALVDAPLYANAAQKPVIAANVTYNQTEINQLKAFAASGNNLTALGWNVNDISTWTGITWNNTTGRVTGINLNYKRLTGTLNVSNFTSLTSLLADGNQLTGVNLAGCTALQALSLSYNSLSSLNVSGNTNLTTLYCRFNTLPALNITACTKLQKLACDYNALTALDVTHNTQLVELSCAGNKLTSLALTQNNKLDRLDCTYNYLDPAALSVSGIRTAKYAEQNVPANAVFADADVQKLLTFANTGNNAAKLNWTTAAKGDWFGITWMKNGGTYYVSEVRVPNCELTGTLSLSGMTHLKAVDCGGNTLETVNVSNCPELVYISCENARLKTLNILNCSGLATLKCGGNYLNITDLQAQFDAVAERAGGYVKFLPQSVFGETSNFYTFEYETLKAFANQGSNLAKLGWDLNVPGEWAGVQWKLFNGKYKVVSLNLNFAAVTGTLNLSGFKQLKEINCANTSLTRVDLPLEIGRLDADAFYNCKSLEKLLIPSAETAIELLSFRYAKDSFTIYSPSGSKAGLYAQENGLNFAVPETYMVGDVNGDLKVGTQDTLLIQQALAMSVLLNPKQAYAADVDKDGQVAMNDLLSIQKYMAAYDVGYPIGQQLLYVQ